MRKILIIIILSLFLISSVHALDWHEQRRIANSIGNELDYEGSFRYAYYQDWRNYNARYIYFGNAYRNSLITFYKPSTEMDKDEFRCLVLHELGHYDDVKEGSREEKLSESYADDYMISKDDTCERFYD